MSDQAAEGSARRQRKSRFGKMLSSLPDRLRPSSPGKSTQSSASGFKTHPENAHASQTDISKASSVPEVLQSVNAVEGAVALQPGEEVIVLDNSTPPPKLHAAKAPTIPALKDITEVWNEAYEDLKVKDSDLVCSYETAISRDLSAIVGSTTMLSGFKVQRREQMQGLVARKIAEARNNEWRLKLFKGKDIPVKDLAAPVVGIVKWADEYIKDALSASPYTSIAWAGVSLLLPLLLNPSEQAVSLVSGLERIANLVSQSTMRENLFARRYGSSTNTRDKTSLSSHILYIGALKELYVQVLKFQLNAVCYFSRADALRIGADFVKWDKWDSLVEEVNTQDLAFQAIYGLLKDDIYQEEKEKLEARHKESVLLATAISSDLSGLRKAIDEAQRDQERKDLLKWLTEINPSQNLRDALDKHEDGTGAWLINDNGDFELWKSSPNSLLWLNGKAGSGKSVLSSTVIHHLEKSYHDIAGTAVAFFYFSFTDTEKQNLDGMLKSIIKQLCCQRPDTPKVLQDLRALQKQDRCLDRNTLEGILDATIKGFNGVFIILDALDECPTSNGEQKLLLNFMKRFRKKSHENLHMFWTSRNEEDIKISYRAHDSSSLKIEIDLSKYKPALDYDIGLYIDTTLDTYDSWTPNMKKEARATLIEKADGMFQYVSCQFDDLRELDNLGTVRKTLQNLPNGLEETYNRMLTNIPPNYRKQVTIILKWIAFSFRSLSIKEAAELFDVDIEKIPPLKDPDYRLSNPHLVLKYLRGLVSCSQEGWYGVEIKFAHFSIKEHLMSQKITSTSASEFFFTELEAHLQISDIAIAFSLIECMDWSTYIRKLMNDSTGRRLREVSTGEYMEKYRLHDYCTEYLLLHLDQAPRIYWSTSLTKGFAKLKDATSNTILLIGAARQGCRKVVELLLDDGVDVNAVCDLDLDGEYVALEQAACGGHEEIVRLLLDRGADVNAIGGEYGTALQAAARWGKEEIVRLLLDRGADVNAIGGKYGTALQAAARWGKEEIVHFLFDQGANVNAIGGKYGTALQAAALWGIKKIVRLLLDRGADVNAIGGKYGTALQAAAKWGWEEIVCLLLDRGADVNAIGGECGTALQAAARWGKEEIVCLLFDQGADVNAIGGEYGTALQAAASGGHEEIVRLLLDRGADVNAIGGEYGTALQAAAGNGYEGIVRLLLYRRADINAIGGEYGTALQAAAGNGYEGIVRLLLDRGADINAIGGEYGTALQAAAGNGDEGSVRLLLDRGADINAIGGEYGTALQAAAGNGDEGSVRLLLDRGADINAIGGEYGTALYAAASEGIVRLLVDRGAVL